MLPGAQRIDAGGTVFNEGDLQRLGDWGAVVVGGVRAQGQRAVGVLLGHLVGAGAKAKGVGALAGVGAWSQDDGARVGEALHQNRVGLGRAHGNLARTGGLGAQIRLAHTLGPGGGTKDVVERSGHSIGINRAVVVEGRALAQGENYRFVVDNVETLGEFGLDLAVLVDGHQCLSCTHLSIEDGIVGVGREVGDRGKLQRNSNRVSVGL